MTKMEDHDLESTPILAKGATHMIEGLYACGNDMQNIFGGEYPGPGAQIGLGMVFGYLAVKHAIGTV